MTTGDYTLDQLTAQEDETVLPHFSLADAIELGALMTEKALNDDLPLTLEVDHLGRLAYRIALPGSQTESDDWLQRKRRVVRRYDRSTLAVRVKYEERGTDFITASGFSELEYAAHGGGFPIRVEGVGVVGAAYASGLPQVDDHEFLVACLRELKSRFSSADMRP